MATEIQWGTESIPRASSDVEFYARRPDSGRPMPLEPRRYRVTIDGEDVTRRCVNADAEQGEVVLLVPDESRSGKRITVWKLNADQSGPELETRRGRVQIGYEWPAVN